LAEPTAAEALVVLLVASQKEVVEASVEVPSQKEVVALAALPAVEQAAAS
jgi:hypothetical protein